MDIDLFDKKYSEKGGINMLRNMVQNSLTLMEIANQFGVSKERAKQWAKYLSGGKYLSLENRKEKRLRIIRKIVQEIGIEKARLVCNKHYLKIIERESKND